MVKENDEHVDDAHQQRSSDIVNEHEESGDDDEEVPTLVQVAEEDANDDYYDKTLQDCNASSACSSVPLPPVPVTILSGFLGSGKTTLIQYILSSNDHGKRIAVIENEFGGGSNDGLSVETLIARDGANNDNLSDLIELPNGCICCTVKDSLVSTLEALLEKRHDLDYILIEASGMANPGPIASLFWLDDALQSRLRLDGVVTLVDAFYIEQQLQQTVEAAQQVAYADRLLLNKVDLVEEQKQQLIHDVLRDIHPTAPIRSTTYSQIPDLDWILDANCFDVDRAKEVDLALSRMEQQDKAEEGDEHHHHHHDSSCTDESCTTCATIDATQHTDNTHTHHHFHTKAVGTIALVHKGSVSLKKMNAWLASLLWPNQDEQNSVLKARLEQQQQEEGNDNDAELAVTEPQIFRIKGILSVQHKQDEIVEEEELQFVDNHGLDSRRFIVQAVFDLWEIHAASKDLQWDRPLNGDSNNTVLERCCKLVVIGRNLQEEELRQGFRSCFVNDSTTTT